MPKKQWKAAKSFLSKSLRRDFFRLLARFWPLLVILGVVLIFFYPVWLEGKVPLPADFVVGVYYPWLDYKWGYSVGVPVKNPITTDVVSFTYPMQMLAIDLLKSGQWPLWNPYILAGTPLLANFQSAPFSPTNFLYWLFDRLTAWSIQIMLQHLLAAIFVYLLLRWWKVGKFPSVLGGTIFAFAGFNGIWSQWNGHALTAAFIPLLILLQDRFLSNGKWYWGVLFSVCVALQVFSGYPQVIFYTAIALALLWLFRFQKTTQYVHRTAFLWVFGLLGLGLAAPQILPGRELFSISQREIEGHPYEWAFLPFVKIITFFAPGYFGNHATQNYWGPQDYTSNTGFVGIIAFSLATLSIVAWEKINVRLLFVLLAVSLVLAFPTPVSIFFWKSGAFGLQAASAHRALILFNLAIALLVGFGAEVFLVRKKMPVFRTFIFPGLILIAFGLLAMWLYKFTPTEIMDDNIFAQGKDQYRTGLRNLVLPTGVFVGSLATLWWSNRVGKFKVLAITFMFFLMVVELYRFWWKFTPFSPRHIVFPTTPVLEFLQAQEKPFRTTGSRVIPVNMRMPYKIEVLEGYDAVYPLHMSQFIAAITSGRSGTQPVGRYGTLGDETARALSLVNVKYNIVLKKDKQKQPSSEGRIPEYFSPQYFPVVFEDKSVAILENKNALSRAFMVYEWEESIGPETLDRFLSPDFPIEKKVLLEKPPLIEVTAPKEQPTVTYKKYIDQESVLSVSSEQNGLLFVSETYYPGWKIYIDGKETEIQKANFAFRAVVVPAGEHIVRFTYQPESFYLGLKVAAVSGMVVIALSLVGRHTRLYT